MGLDCRLKCVTDLMVFVVAAIRSIFRQVTLLDDVSEEFWVSTIRDAEDVVEALSWGSMFVGEIF